MRSALACLFAASCGRIGFAPGAGDGGNGDGIRINDGNRPDIVFDANAVFVTGPVATPGSFGGLVGADAICQTAADQSGLPGTYIAWLSTSATNAIDRLSGSRGWVRTDGTPFADQPTDIAAGTVWSPISIAADGSDQGFGDTVVTTGTEASGMAALTCADWTAPSSTATFGNLTALDDAWTVISGAMLSCSVQSRIYCFGIGKQTAVAAPTVIGRRAFYARPVTVGGGVAGLDASCQAHADAASLGGTFRAFVATTTATAISRFDTSGPRWVRLDGVPLAPSAADLAVGLRVPLNQYADGTYYAVAFGAAKAWTGADDPAALGTGPSTCTDWTATGPSQLGYHGQPTAGGAAGFHNGERRCDEGSFGVYCLEQ